MGPGATQAAAEPALPWLPSGRRREGRVSSARGSPTAVELEPLPCPTVDTRHPASWPPAAGSAALLTASLVALLVWALL